MMIEYLGSAAAEMKNARADSKKNTKIRVLGQQISHYIAMGMKDEAKKLMEQQVKLLQEAEAEEAPKNKVPETVRGGTPNTETSTLSNAESGTDRALQDDGLLVVDDPNNGPKKNFVPSVEGVVYTNNGCIYRNGKLWQGSDLDDDSSTDDVLLHHSPLAKKKKKQNVVESGSSGSSDEVEFV